jgi:hypothetical protein
MRRVMERSAGIARAFPFVLAAVVVATTVFLVGLVPAGAVTITVDFEHLPSLPTQPSTFAAAGAMQTYSSAGIFSITGGVVLGNPTFLAAFPAHGSAPNAYGTADFADLTLLSTIELDMPAAARTTSVSFVLFNGQPVPETYVVDFFSGATLISGCAETFSSVPAASSPSGFASPSCSSTLASPITRVTITTPNAELNGWDFFVDTLVLVENPVTAVPEPASLVLLMAGSAVAIGCRGWRRRKR